VIEILKTHDFVRLNYLEAVLRDAGLHPVIFEGVAPYPGTQPRRLMIPEDEVDQAKRLLRDADR
jgi:hypothetical protein